MEQTSAKLGQRKKFALALAIAIAGIFLVYVFITGDKNQPLPMPSQLEFIAAGVPQPISRARDYEKIFSHLKESGITGFFPYFAYQEVPEAKSFAFDADFLPPCTKDSPAFKALREFGIKLLIPGEIIYYAPTPNDFPAPEKDMLKQIIECAGRNNVLGITSYDEPVFRNLLDVSRLLYQRVKTIDPTLPVFMIHGPILATIIEEERKRPITDAEVEYYLEQVKKYSRFADVVGFDAYPIPPELSQVATPYSDGAAVAYQKVLPDYLDWLKKHITRKSHMFVLQAFSYENLGESWLGAHTKDARPPSKGELEEMIRLTKAGGASYVIWYGQSFLDADDISLWNDVIASIKTLQ